MVQINFALKEVNCKIVYYGPGLSGKTTNLEVVHNKAPKSHVGDLTSIATEGDRTLFFDFLPLSLGQVAGMNTKFQIYTVPGQVYYNSTRKLVLQGADGIVFVADSRRDKIEENLESLKNLEENLKEYGMDINTIPLVLQYNKRDLKDIFTVDELQQHLNRFGAPYFEAVAVTGEGVFPTLKKLSSMVLENLNRQHGSSRSKARKPVPAREPELVAAGGTSRGAAVAEAPRGGPPTGAVKRVAPAAPRAEPAAARPNVVREKVTSAPGVRQIERKVPAAAVPVVKKRSREEPAAAGAAPSAAGSAKGGGKALWAIIIVVILAALGAAVYFSGLLK